MKFRMALVLLGIMGAALAHGGQKEQLPKNWPRELAFLTSIGTPHSEVRYQCFPYHGAQVMCQIKYWEFTSSMSVAAARKLIRERLQSKTDWTFPPFKTKWWIPAEAVRLDTKGKPDVQIAITKRDDGGCLIQIYI